MKNLFGFKSKNQQVKELAAVVALAHDAQTAHAADGSGSDPQAQAPAAASPQTREPSAYFGADSGAAYTFDIINSFFGGDKFAGGFGLTKDYFIDYWTLRVRSVQLFTENPYAKGILNRLITNEINTGLTLEATPEDTLISLSEEAANTWAENTEILFKLWGENKKLCDWRQQETFSQLEQTARRTALLSGDIVVILRQSTATRLPIVEIIDGVHVISPGEAALVQAAKRRGNKILHGVELDKNNRHVAYFIKTADGKSRRVPVVGEKSKRRMAFMIYGSKRRVDDVRGMPLLACVLQSLKEIDRYRDSEQRAAFVNSILALFVKKTKDKPGSLPVTGGAVRKDTVEVEQGDGSLKSLGLSRMMPGLYIDELQTGEEPTSYDTKRPNVNFKEFEAAIISAVAWALEIPPEILFLSFNNNYSASRAAINEFKLYLDKARTDFAQDFCKPIYEQWLINMVLIDMIVAPGFLEAWRDPRQWHVFGAWLSSEWAGAIKPSVDREKEVKAYERMIKKGWITNDRASKELTGTKFSQNVKRLTKENEQIADANKPLLDAGILKPEKATAEIETDEIVAEVIDELSHHNHSIQ